MRTCCWTKPSLSTKAKTGVENTELIQTIISPLFQPHNMGPWEGKFSFCQESKLRDIGTSLAVQWLGVHASTARGMGSIPRRGAKIPQAGWHGQKRKPKRHLQGWDSVAWGLQACLNLTTGAVQVRALLRGQRWQWCSFCLDQLATSATIREIVVAGCSYLPFLLLGEQGL